jgi:hypothetical protein
MPYRVHCKQPACVRCTIILRLALNCCHFTELRIMRMRHANYCTNLCCTHCAVLQYHDVPFPKTASTRTFHYGSYTMVRLVIFVFLDCGFKSMLGTQSWPRHTALHCIE